MPPSGTPPQVNEGHAINTEPYYSNEDVAILHDIVALAQELLPTLPERERLPTNALFTAYYDILPRIGIDADHDSRYARVLFKIGGLRGNATLYERFEEVLLRMGIEIEFGDDDEDYDDEEGIDNATAGTTPPQDESVETKGQRRRNSESSFWDLGNKNARITSRRRNSFDNTTQATPQPEGKPRFLQEIRSNQSSAPPPAFNQKPKAHETDHQDHIGAWLDSHDERPRRRGRSRSTHSSLRIRRRAPSTEHGWHGKNVPPSIPESDHYQAASEDTAVTSALDFDTVSVQSLERHINQETQDLMRIKSSLFIQDHLTSFVGRQIPLWREKALKFREHRLKLERIAVIHDKTVLLHISLTSWRSLRIERRVVRERAQRCHDLEQKAARCRDNFLMAKYFEQWSWAARHKVDCIDYARKHVIKVRCFNAWVEITAVNEFKVRRQVLNKFFGVWKRRHTSLATSNDLAVRRYESNLVEKTYWQWLRKNLDAKATSLWTERVKRRALFSLISRYHTAWEIDRNAKEDRRYKLMWNAWKIWRERTTAQVRQGNQAIGLFNTKICRKAFSKLTQEARVVPVRNIIRTDVNKRILRNAFDTWLYRARNERQAAEVDRTKILREAITTWRYQCRSQILRAKVERRLKVEALFSLIEAEKSALIERKRKERWLRDIMHTWMAKARMLKEKRLRLEAVAELHLTRRSQASAMNQWFVATQNQKRLENFSVELNRQRLLSAAVTKWIADTRHLQKLESWSRDANFFFLTTRTVKRWKTSSEASIREKRKAAYAQVRRTVKIHLAARILSQWHRKSRHVLDLQDQARSLRQNKDIILGMDIFDRWRAQAADVRDLESTWQEKVLRKHFSIWEERSSAYRTLEREAILTYQEKRENRAFKRWNLATLQLRAHTAYAQDIREKNAKRTFRKMLAYWRQKAAIKRPPKIPELDELHDDLSSIEKAEAWSEYGESHMLAQTLNAVVPSTPIPGYLTTPSKRTERIMAVAERFSTTPKAPLSTPFERHLRAQYSGVQLHPSRKVAGKSMLSMSRGFDDIPGKSHE